MRRRYDERMRRLIAPAALIVVFTISGCSAATPTPDPEVSSAPAVVDSPTPESTVPATLDEAISAFSQVSTRAEARDALHRIEAMVNADCEQTADQKPWLFDKLLADLDAFDGEGAVEAIDILRAKYPDAVQNVCG